MKRRYKVLPLPGWCFLPRSSSPLLENFRRKRAECLERHEQITPVFNRPGYYFDRSDKTEWVEFDGEAWKLLKTLDFMFDLRTSKGNNRLDPDVFHALGVLIDHKLATPKQREMHDTETWLRYINRSRINGLKSIKRMRDFKKSHNLR